jgi:N-acetyl-gamma-glutamyl-phosphate reductase
MAEFEQEFTKAAGQPVTCSFTPHLAPQNRGILATIYLKGDASPHTRHVRGSNFCDLGVVADRRPGRVIVFSALDNLVKGASGQAIQNANLMLGLDETAGLMAAPLFP